MKSNFRKCDAYFSSPSNFGSNGIRMKVLWFSRKKLDRFVKLGLPEHDKCNALGAIAAVYP
jgi:hypothetical protein